MKPSWTSILASVAVISFGGSALGASEGNERSPTSVTIIISTAIEMVQVGGDLSPSHFGDSVRVTQFKRKSDGWKKIEVKEVTMEDFGTAGDFVTIFEPFPKGRCKIKVRFAGDQDHQPSIGTRTYRCSGDGLEGPARGQTSEESGSLSKSSPTDR